MATYNLREVMPDKIVAGDVLNLPYRIGEADFEGKSESYGGSKTVLLPKGEYLLECWGSASSFRAKQWSVNWAIAGTGGYARGTLTLNSDTNVILTPGGVGTNGGIRVGRMIAGEAWTGSGGGSDIRLIQNDEYHRVIVAGGGGQPGSYNVCVGFKEERIQGADGTIYVERVPEYNVTALYGGWGGGTYGGNGEGYPLENPPYISNGSGGTYHSGGTTRRRDVYDADIFHGAFLRGGYNKFDWGIYAPAGGGGWYGGGGGGYAVRGTFGTLGYEILHGTGGGGSGFVWERSASVPENYALGSEYYLKNTVNVSGHEDNAPILEPDGVTYNTGHKDEGYCRITVLGTFSGIYIGDSNGKARSIKAIYIGDSNGKARRVIKGYIGDSNGKAKRFL